MATVSSKCRPRLTPQCGTPGDAPAHVAGDNARMNIILNGEPVDIAADSTVSALLLAQGLADRRVAVEVNAQIVPRSRHPDHVLQPGDRVEIVHALGGG
jgi:sulfur carrier protein